MSMKWNEEDWVRLPKFILGSDCHEALEGASQWGDSEYVTHLHSPRFVGEVLHDDEGTTIKPHWIDEPEADAMATAKLMREAGDWYSMTRPPEEGPYEPEPLTPEQEKEAKRWLDKYGGDDGLEKLKEDNPELAEAYELEKMAPQNDYEALVFGLWLALTAPKEDERYDECVAIAEGAARRLTEEEVEQAQEEAKRHVRWHNNMSN